MKKETSLLVDKFLQNFKHWRICTDDWSDVTKNFLDLVEKIENQK